MPAQGDVLFERQDFLSHDDFMGKVVVKIRLTNLFDLALRNRGLAKKRPREIEIEALVDSGATRLYLKPSVIKKLGLKQTDKVKSQTTNGNVVRNKYEPVQLELMGRKENFDVIDIPETVPEPSRPGAT